MMGTVVCVCVCLFGAPVRWHALDLICAAEQSAKGPHQICNTVDDMLT